MSERVTSKTIKNRVALLARLSGMSFQIDHAACYGGYRLESADGRHSYSSRLPAKEMMAFIDGMLAMLEVPRTQQKEV